jgi:hypothetical protein
MQWLTKLLDVFKNKKKYSFMDKSKEIATANKEPWVGIISFEVDPDNISDGAVELDWNDYFIARLIKAGYPGKTDQELVDLWFTNVCKNIVSGNYEQAMADPEIRRVISKIQKTRLDNGRSEIG